MEYSIPRCYAKKNGFQIWRHTFAGQNKVTGEMRSFFIELCLINPQLNPKSVVLGMSHQKDKKNRDMRPSYVLVKAGCFGKGAKQMHQFYPGDKLSVSRKRLEISVQDQLLTDTELRGSVSMSYSQAVAPELMSDGGFMKWNLQMQKLIGTKISRRATKGPDKNRMYWQVPGCKTQYAGAVLFDGEEYTVFPHKSFGYTDVIWGKDFVNPWVMLNGSSLVSQITGKRLSQSCFDVGGFFGKEKNKRLAAIFHHEGNEYQFNASGRTHKDNVKFDFTENGGICHWTITAQNSKALVDIEVFCKTEEMILMNYENPNGEKNFKRLLAGASGYGEIRLYKKIQKSLEIIEQARIENAGCMYGKY